MKAQASMTASALGLLVAMLLPGGKSLAENECGAPEPRVEIVCSSSNYDPSGGNIFYGPDKSNGDFTVRLAGDLALDYDRENPGDDVYIVPDDPENPRHSAVWITPTETGYGYTGDISVFSSADVTSNARGVSVGHYGESGGLRMELMGGNFTTRGERAFAVHSYHEGAGDIRIIAGNLAVNTAGVLADAIISSHAGQGNINIDVRGGAFAATGSRADGIHAQHRGEEGDINVDVQGLTIAVNGERSNGLIAHHQGLGDNNIDVQNVTFAATGLRADGIRGQHLGEGDININVQSSNLSTMGDRAFGIIGLHTSEGNVNVGARRLTVNTVGDLTDALFAAHTGEGNVNVDVRDVAFTVTGDIADGILALHEGEKGDINVDAQGLTVTVNGERTSGVYVHSHQEGDSHVSLREIDIAADGRDADGIRAEHESEGDINVDVQGGDIAAKGEGGFGIIGHSHGSTGDVNIGVQDLTITTGELSGDGILGQHEGAGDVNIEARGGRITVMNTGVEGIHGLHEGTGHVNIDVREVTIATESTELAPDSGDASAHGVYGDHRGAEGDVKIDVRGGSMTTMGANSYGVYARHANPTDDDDNPLTDSDNNVIQGTGGIAIGLTGSEVSTLGEGSHGVYAEHESGIGEIRITVDGGTIRAGGINASGIQLGRLNEEGIIERAAALGADSYRKQTVTVNGRVTGGSGANAAGVFLAGGGKVAIGPKGSVGAASGIAMRAAGGAPRLHVDLNLAGRRMGTVLQEGSIINDGGETTIVVNGVPLHDGVAGATGRTVLNGAWDLTLQARDTIIDRDFSAEDFSETYAPRAAVYEALPGLLLRLHSRGPAGERLTAPGSPAWVRVAGGGGRYTPVQASVGAKYNFRRIEVEAGLDVELGPRLTGTLSVRHVQGSGDVSSPTGGGKITARGLGGAFGLAWQGPQGYYFRGRVSVMDYDVDLTADRRGTLLKDASAVGHSLGFETGRRFTLSKRFTLTPRVWVTRSKIDLGFTDAVQSRLWAEDSDRLTAGTGLVAETERVWDNGTQALAVRGTVDLWRTLGDGTAVNVSQGAPLRSVSDKTRLLLSLGGVYRWGRFSVSSDVAAGGPGSRDQEYAGYLNLGIQF